MAVIIKPAPEGSVCCCCCDRPAIATICEVEDSPSQAEARYIRMLNTSCKLGQAVLIICTILGAAFTPFGRALFIAGYCAIAFVVVTVLRNWLTSERFLKILR